MTSAAVRLLILVLSWFPLAPAVRAACEPQTLGLPGCAQLERLTIFGSAQSARDVAGGASTVSHEDLEQFESSDPVRALRRVPGISVQLEDGWGLRPNLGIRGTASERSSRVTLMEDGVLIAPAPYSAPAAYYSPTFGRIRSVEVLKGPASITEGPYTVGGAINLLSTPIPAERGGQLQGEYGSDSTWRVHGWYGGRENRLGYLAETHQWASDGFQRIDRSSSDTGLEKQDYLARLALESAPDAALDQQLELKLQASEEDSRQSYLGLSDADFGQDPLRRYGLSELDEMHNEHTQVVLAWRLETAQGSRLTITGYDNGFERAWYKTEGFDPDGSANPSAFRGSSWANVLAAANTGQDLVGMTAPELQSVLEGADTPAGSIQLRNNARDYYSRGIQLSGDRTLFFGSFTHALQAGLRYHADEEDRLQRNDNFQQVGGRLELNSRGLDGNAGNEVNAARAWAAYVHDRIEFGRWTLAPGLRYENIDLRRTRYLTNSANPASRNPANFRDYRENHLHVWIPGIGTIFEASQHTSLIGGIHRGFAVPGNSPGTDPEESTNYEFGLRHERTFLQLEAMFFFNDYENLVGVCTNSSGSNCEPGAAFNGEAVHVPGLEISASASVDLGPAWSLPLQLSYTWMNAEFESSFVSEFFGTVSKGDPVPYVPDRQAWASIGLTDARWSFYLSASHVAATCTRASCGAFEETGSGTVFDFAAHYAIDSRWELYALAENLSDEQFIAAREPYGARPVKPRTFMLGLEFSF